MATKSQTAYGQMVNIGGVFLSIECLFNMVSSI